MSTMQLYGTVRIGTNAATPVFTDVSNYVTSTVLTRSRNTVSTSATYGTPYQSERAGAKKDSITFNFIDDFAATAFRQILWDIMDTDASEMAFTVNFEKGATSATNKRYSGTAVVTGAETGGDVESERSQSQTFPVLSPGFTVSSV